MRWGDGAIARGRAGSASLASLVGLLALGGCGGSATSIHDGAAGHSGVGGAAGAGGAGGAAVAAGSGAGGAAGNGVGGAGASGAGGRGGSAGTGAGGAPGGTSGGADAGASDAAVDASSLCPSPPAPTGAACTTVPQYQPMAMSFALWIADAFAPGGGWRVTLPFNGSSAAGGHTYVYKNGSLTGMGGNGIYGDAAFDVDGKSNQIQFHYEGCPQPTGQGTWGWTAMLTIANATCQGCADVHVGRHFTITQSPADGGTTFTFVADEPPRDCGNGVDLLRIVLP